MKEYFMGIIAVVSVGSLLLSLVPSSSYSKQLRLLCGLCSAGCIILPLLMIAGDIDAQRNDLIGLFEQREVDNEYYAEIYNNTIAGAEGENAEERLKNEIIKALSLKNDSFDINIIIGNKSDEKYIEKIELIIYADGIGVDPHAVSNYIDERIGCETQVIYDFK